MWIWTSFIAVRFLLNENFNCLQLQPIKLLQSLFADRDPRRSQPVADGLLDLLHSIDFNGESAFEITKALAFFKSFYHNCGRKAFAWSGIVLDICWTHIDCRYAEVTLNPSMIFISL